MSFCSIYREKKRLFDSANTSKVLAFHAVDDREEQSDAVVWLERILYMDLTLEPLQ